MAIYARAGANFTPAPAGPHAAICVDVVDLGEVKTEWKGTVKMKHMIRIVWQIEEDRDDGKPFSVSKRFNLSLHEKAGLRKDLESWRGRPFTDEELRGFDVETVLSAGCFLNVIHENKNGQTFANVTSIMKLPKNMTAPSPRDYVRVCDRQPDQAGAVPPIDDSFNGISDEDVPF